MRERSILLLVVLSVLLCGCMPKRTPAIDYENFSYGGGVVRNIKVRFNKFYPLGKSEAKFCGGSSQFHSVSSYDNFFGPIHIEWENAKGKKLSKDLILTKEQLPNFKPSKNYLSSVYLYFTQDDVYLYTSDTPNLQQIRDDLYKKAGLTCQEYRDREYIKKWGKDW